MICSIMNINNQIIGRICRPVPVVAMWGQRWGLDMTATTAIPEAVLIGLARNLHYNHNFEFSLILWLKSHVHFILFLLVKLIHFYKLSIRSQEYWGSQTGSSIYIVMFIVCFSSARWINHSPTSGADAVCTIHTYELQLYVLRACLSIELSHMQAILPIRNPWYNKI